MKRRIITDEEELNSAQFSSASLNSSLGGVRRNIITCHAQFRLQNRLHTNCSIDQHLPHVDEILGQSHGLAVPCDGDGPVQVGGGVSVLAVGDADHGSGELSAETIIISNTVLEFSLHLISATLDPPLPMMQPMSSLGTVISWVCCWAAWLLAWPVNKARAREEY